MSRLQQGFAETRTWVTGFMVFLWTDHLNTTYINALSGSRRISKKITNLALEVADISNNLGDAKTLITHPATTAHQRLEEEERARLGISDGMVRLSVGLEDPIDLIDDIERALSA